MKEYFLDSSALFAALDKDNTASKTIKSFLQKEPTPLVTTNFIFAESISLITKRLGKGIGIQTGKLLLQTDYLRLVFIDERLQKEAWELYSKYQDKDFDFIDATSFVFCQKNKIREVLTLDHHFIQMGFQILPS